MTELFCELIQKQSQIEVNTLLHLGSGAGSNDYTFKRHFKVTGIDISDKMLKVARTINPKVTNIKGDMREIRLRKEFDVVVIPESIGHMTTLFDLSKAIQTAYEHIKPGGLLLLAALVHEDFQENNFVYTGSKGNIEITLFENNYMQSPSATTYEATVFYLIRRNGQLETASDRVTIVVFKRAIWHDLLSEISFDVNSMELKNIYDQYLLGDSNYLMIMFICKKLL
mgnify:FL=1